MDFHEKTDRKFVIRKLEEYIPTDHDKDFTEYVKKVFQDDLLAVILYGSTLYASEKKRSGITDYFTIVKSYRYVPGGRLPRIMAGVAPPLQYSARLDDSLPGNLPSAKFHVLSIDDLDNGTGRNAPDTYVLGRFSKRIALVYSANEVVKESIADSILSAGNEIVRRAYPFFGTDTSLDEKIKQCLYFSYRGEIRIENFSKVDGIFENGKEYYRIFFGFFINRFIDDSTGDKPFSMDEAMEFIRRSRRRAILRWPVMILTVKGWQDILLHKLERTHGVRLELSEREQRYPLFAAGKHFFRLRREGKIR